ncbi:hypothetical protein NDU88_007649 [Pleurodeles waltl]|uniref:Uncharacterized protein n=1 Tax=Pleurodeles waltl TaxID=8319 RepID=A0AAV7RQV5_PLEWA|nr:hypothetical protein NDU88_007649 [Pleurodeles waltl]
MSPSRARIRPAAAILSPDLWACPRRSVCPMATSLLECAVLSNHCRLRLTSLLFAFLPPFWVWMPLARRSLSGLFNPKRVSLLLPFRPADLLLGPQHVALNRPGLCPAMDGTRFPHIALGSFLSEPSVMVLFRCPPPAGGPHPLSLRCMSLQSRLESCRRGTDLFLQPEPPEAPRLAVLGCGNKSLQRSSAPSLHPQFARTTGGQSS